MPYEIGRIFSDAVQQSIDRNRDRAAAHPQFARREERYNTGLAEAMIRADQEAADRALRERLGTAELDLRRTDQASDYDLGQQRLDMEGTIKGADLSRRADADAALATYRGGLLGVKEGEASARGQRYRDRTAYETAATASREAKNAIDAQRLAMDQKKAEYEIASRQRRDQAGVVDLIRKAKADALREPAGWSLLTPDVQAILRRNHKAEFLDIIRRLEGFATTSPEEGGRGQGGPARAEAHAAFKAIMGDEAEGMDEGSFPDDELDEETGYQDWGR